VITTRIGALVLIVTTGCAPGAGPELERDESAPFQTSALEYRLESRDAWDYQFEVLVPVSYTNRESFAVALDPCGAQSSTSFYLQVRDSATWEGLYGRACADIWTPPPVVPPGSTWVDTAFILAFKGPTNAGQVVDPQQIPGVFRLRYKHLPADSLGEEDGRLQFPDRSVPRDSSFSNSFVVTW
jgi:hypothetical protein